MTEERSSRVPRSIPRADVDGWPRTGEVPASRRARVWISPERARWAREERRSSPSSRTARSSSSAASPGCDWLVREVLKEAGDAVVLEPADARDRACRGARPQAIREATRPLGSHAAEPSRRAAGYAARRMQALEGPDPVRRQGHAPAADHPHERQAARAGGQQAGAVLRDRGDGRGRDRGGRDHHRARDRRRDPAAAGDGRRRRFAVRRAAHLHRPGRARSGSRTRC